MTAKVLKLKDESEEKIKALESVNKARARLQATKS